MRRQKKLEQQKRRQVSEPVFSPEFYAKWEHLIDSLEISDVPIRFIREVEVIFKTGDNTVFDIRAMIQAGYDSQDIEEDIERYFDHHDKRIDTVNFHIDIPAVASEVTNKTNQLLDK